MYCVSMAVASSRAGWILAQLLFFQTQLADVHFHLIHLEAKIEQAAPSLRSCLSVYKFPFFLN